ncbi:cystatin-B-like [Trematomus bernacchii]|uniref:cystatin-B-like n=1 Tax=Trematomus bernacchii TaxID=40690 RepID=UPI00146F6D91|nr:cystatin-B-like [Trematomus bernacchii]XP_034001350.1 cystatin-B-like [Trematomus bernacchii]
MADKAMLGGWGETVDATEETQKICDAVKGQVEKETGKKYAVYKAVHFKKQLVEGQNLSIKVFVGEEDYIHQRVVCPLPGKGGKVQLDHVEVGKTKDDIVCMC